MKRIKTSNSKKYSSFQDALLDCQNLGYLDSEIANHVKNKTQKLVSESFENYELSESDLRILLMAFRASQRGSLKVLDFGGAAGYHYFLFKKWCTANTAVEWTVVETKTMVDKCIDLQNSELRFVSNIPTDRKSSFDLILAASSLQYTSDPLAVLTELLQMNSTFFCITKTPMLSSSETLICIQASKLSDHGPGKKFIGGENELVLTPVTFMFKDSVLRKFQEENYSFQVTQDTRSSFQFNRKEIPTFTAFGSSNY
jgi:putative methyltransferase (TIGR04325 family)